MGWAALHHAPVVVHEHLCSDKKQCRVVRSRLMRNAELGPQYGHMQHRLGQVAVYCRLLKLFNNHQTQKKTGRLLAWLQQFTSQATRDKTLSSHGRVLAVT